ncbi:MAG: bifunctional MaoC family dehydratase N-terminal/OB-fold nucleic acid binding domain-containing protein [Myxococcota bacterium]
MPPDALEEQLAPWLGREGPAEQARDAVNTPMVRHWCDAVGDDNPVYLDADFAAKSVHGECVAPPTMLQAWTMRGLRPPAREGGVEPAGEVLRLLDEAGYTSVVATNCRQDYARYLRDGDRLSVTTQVASVSPEKKTALGIGRFVDELLVYRDAEGEEVARMTFRLLKFIPPAAKPSAAALPRPKPAQNTDNAFFWEGVAQGELRIQRCLDCGHLQHPPTPMCPKCQSLQRGFVVSSGRGEVYSFVVAHHPAIPPFAYPNAIVLVELEEGTRVVSNLVGVDPADITIGMPVEVEFTRVDEDLVLPLFHAVPDA